MMKLILALILVCTAPALFAHEFFYTSTLSGASGSGVVNVELDLDLVTMGVDADFTGLVGMTTGAHVRGLTATPLTGTAGVLSLSPTLPAFPTGVTAGHYSQTIDLTEATAYDPAFIQASGGTVSDALNALIFGMADGRTYFEVSTTAAPTGEISGFLVPTPEPSSIAAVTLAGIALLRRSRTRVI